MPIWLRKLTFNRIQEFYNKEQEELKKLQSQSGKSNTTNIDMATTNKVKIPDFIKSNPTYRSTVAKSTKK